MIEADGPVPTVEELRGYLVDERGIATAKVPERIEIMTDWPTTATGKVQKFLLRQRFS